MERCSICKGRLQDNVCSRCGTDLTMLLLIEQQAKFHLKQAIVLLGQENLEQSRLTIERSLQLKREPLTLLLHGFINSIASSDQVPTEKADVMQIDYL